MRDESLNLIDISFYFILFHFISTNLLDNFSIEWSIETLIALINWFNHTDSLDVIASMRWINYVYLIVTYY